MKWAIGLVAALAVAGCGASDADKTLAAKCVPNADKLLSLTFAAFDQDPSGGWRSLEAQAGCEGAIADLIARYRKRKPDEAKTLEWREAQLRAAAGQTDRAIKLLQHQAELAGAGDPSPHRNPAAGLARCLGGGGQTHSQDGDRTAAGWRSAPRFLGTLC